MNALVEGGAARAIRNALVSAKRTGALPIQGPCKIYKACGAGLVVSAAAVQICPLCALLLKSGVSKTEPDLTGKAAEALGVTEDWILSFFQGYDGEELSNGERVAYRMGRKLWEKFKPMEDDHV